jgi:hypothetical protein
MGRGGDRETKAQRDEEFYRLRDCTTARLHDCKTARHHKSLSIQILQPKWPEFPSGFGI